MIIYPKELQQKFSPKLLVGQFILCRSHGLIPDSWIIHSLNHWFLGCHPALPLIKINTDTGEVLGYLLGYPISKEGELLSDAEPTVILKQSANLESFLYDFSGCFIAIMLAGVSPRVYLDSCGSLAAVFSPYQEVVASSLSLIPYCERTGDHHELIDAMGIPFTKAMYPLGMTPRVGVERLLPNHYLDLTDWRAVRHWPNKELNVVTETSAAVAEIAYLTKQNITAVARRFPLQMSLTAGQDSRMLLACAKQYKQNIAFFTYALPDRVGRLDCFMAKRMAKRFGLRHRILPFRRADETELELWLYRTGCSVGEVRGFKAMRTVKQLDPTRVYLPGIVAEVGRGFYWKSLKHISENSSKNEIDAKSLLNIMHAPVNRQTSERVQRWLAGLPTDDALQVLDLFYIEQRLGCWAGVIALAYAGMSAFELWTLNSRRILQLMLALPIEYRRKGRLNVDVIQTEWSELMDFPFNRAMGWYKIKLDLIRNLKRTKEAAFHPGKAVRKIAQIGLKNLH